MANPQPASLRPWFLESVPFVVVLLIVAHGIALISYREGAAAPEEKSTLRRNSYKRTYLRPANPAAIEARMEASRQRIRELEERLQGAASTHCAGCHPR